MPKLFHFSEDPSISCFVPRPHPFHPTLPPAVWAIDEERAPMYFLPRDCSAKPLLVPQVWNCG